MLGGAVWQIAKDSEHILYAVDFNHARERHLNGTVLETFTRPTCLIADAYNALIKRPPRKDRDAELINSVMRGLRAGGDVLLPVDAAGRVLELLVCLHKVVGGHYPMILLSNVSYNTVDFASSQIEWMSQGMMNSFDQKRDNPFSFQHLKLCHKIEELESIPGPRLILASSETLETGYAQDVFMTMAANPANLVLITNRCQNYCLASKLLAARELAPDSKDAFQVKFTRLKNIKLEGAALETYISARRMEREQKELETTKMEPDSDDENEGDGASFSSRNMFTFQSLSAAFPMYPCVEPKMVSDMYGAQINLAEFKRIAENSSNVSGFVGTSLGTLLLHFCFFFSQSVVIIANYSLFFVNLPDKPNAMEVELQESKPAAAQVRAAPAAPEVPLEPHKTVQEEVELTVACEIMYIDFEGRSDGNSMRKIISKVAPRKLILVHGSDLAKEDLKSNLPASVCGEVFTPTVNQSVDITSESNIFRLNLKHELAASLNFSQFGDYEVAYADGQVLIDYDTCPVPILQSIPAGTEPPGHSAVFLGNVNFSAIKSVLNLDGIKADFYGGVLVINGGIINVRKVSPTQISIQVSSSLLLCLFRGCFFFLFPQRFVYALFLSLSFPPYLFLFFSQTHAQGCLCEEYYRVRSLLYGQYQIL